jgi:hypothetical protein
MQLTLSRNAEKIAVQYLQHEFRKIIGNAKNKKLWRSIDSALAQLSLRWGESSFWNLVAAISEDWKLKAVFSILSDTKYKWRREKVALEKIVLTGMSPAIDRYTIKKFQRSPIRFREAWIRNEKMRKDILATGFGYHKERDHFPIFLHESDDGLRVFDGMRRTLLAAIEGKKYLDAWVGRVTNPKGKPLISGGFAYVFSQVYFRALKREGQRINKPFIKVGRIISKEYRNANDVFKNRIARWNQNKEVKKVFGQMTK